jgi:hypothetical protein
MIDRRRDVVALLIRRNLQRLLAELDRKPARRLTAWRRRVGFDKVSIPAAGSEADAFLTTQIESRCREAR